MFMGFSLHERFQAGREAEFPLPLAAIDTEKERQIIEKDEEVGIYPKHFIRSVSQLL